MLADEHPLCAGAAIGKPREPERRGVRSQGVVGNDRRMQTRRVRRFDARVHVVTEITVRPSVESALADGSHVVGDEIASNLVALVDGHPQCAGLRLPGESDGIAQSGCEHTMCAGCDGNLPDTRAVGFVLHAVFADVTVGSHADVQVRSIWRCDQTLRPMMIDRSAR